MSILEILNEIAATSSTKEKEAILCREKNNTLLKDVFAATYNPLISYYIKKIPTYSPANKGSEQTLEWGISCLSELAVRTYTGNIAIDYLRCTLDNLSVSDAIVLARIIDRDLRCGCSDTIASRVWPGLVPVFDVMLCDKDMSRIKYPAIAQTKCDGARVHLFYDGKTVKAMSRAGKEFQLLGTLDNSAAAVMKAGDCFDGELLVIKSGKVVDRKIGNGILNKANKGTISQEEAEMIVAVVWDIVDPSSTIPYKTRLYTLSGKMWHGIDNKIKLVHSEVVVSEDAAMEFFAKQLAAGEEGAIIKNMDSKWVPKRSKDQCKLKEIQTADLVVVDMVEGTGKYVGMLGKFICETSDGKLQVGVGSGFSDEERVQYWSKNSIGLIIEMLYNQKITAKGKDKASLFLPRFSSVRFDKTVANTLEELK